MKKGRIVLGLVALVTTVGSSLAFKAHSNFNIKPLYRIINSVCTIQSCWTVALTDQVTPCSTGVGIKYFTKSNCPTNQTYLGPTTVSM
jgi:hypothetical protein